MIARLQLVTIGLIGLLLAAAPVSSQDVAGTLGLPRFYESFRDNNFRVADVEPINSRPACDLPSLNNKYTSAEPVFPTVELLPPVEDTQTVSPSSVSFARPATADPVFIKSQDHGGLPDVGGFERIATPPSAAVIDSAIIDGDAEDEGEAAAKKKLKSTKIWSGNVEFGLDGTEGNSQTFNVHIGFDLKRKTNRNIFTSSLDYNKNNSDSINTANRLLHESRLERPHCSTSWTWYVHEQVDYDEFQPWNVQVNVDTGIGYQLIETESTDFTGRFGSGCSHEIGGPDDAYVPELLFGLEFEHRIGDLQKIRISLEYFPDVTDFSEYRMVDKASWEVLLNKKLNLSLSFNATETVNCPNPGGKEGDLDYSSVLLWNF